MRHFLSLNYTQLQLFTMRGNLEHIGRGTPRWTGFMHFGVLDQKRTLQSEWPSSFFRSFLRKAREWLKSLASRGLSCWLVLFTSMLLRLIVFHASTLSIFGKLALASVHVSDTSGTSVRKVTSRPLFQKSGCTEAHIEAKWQVLSNYSMSVWAPWGKNSQPAAVNWTS